MKYSDSQLSQATRGTALFAELMSSITQTTLRHYSGYIPSIMDVVEEHELTFTVELNERLPQHYAREGVHVEKYQTVLTAEFDICSHCLMSFKQFLAGDFRISKNILTVYPPHYNEMTCKLCGRYEDGLPF